MTLSLQTAATRRGLHGGPPADCGSAVVRVANSQREGEGCLAALSGRLTGRNRGRAPYPRRRGCGRVRRPHRPSWADGEQLLPRCGGGRRGHSVSARPSSGPGRVSSSPNSGSVSRTPGPGGGSSGRRPFDRGVVAIGMATRDPGGLACGFATSRDVARGRSGTSRDFAEGSGRSRDFASRSSASSDRPFMYAPTSFLRSFRASCAR